MEQEFAAKLKELDTSAPSIQSVSQIMLGETKEQAKLVKVIKLIIITILY